VKAKIIPTVSTAVEPEQPRHYTDEATGSTMWGSNSARGKVFFSYPKHPKRV
jgi:hypothetical protein